MGEGHVDVFLCASSTGHVLLLVVKLVVASLSASNHLGQRIVLMGERQQENIHVLLDFAEEQTSWKISDIAKFYFFHLH